MARRPARSSREFHLSPKPWAWALAVVLVPLCLLNLAVGWLGDTAVSPLSPFFIGPKLSALQHYARHRAGCLFGEAHPPLEPLAEEAARRHGLPPGLLESVLAVESAGRVHRISAAGAMGPGQLFPTTAALLHVADPFDPEESLDASARYLAAQLARFHDERLAVAAYNAGAGAVNGEVPHNGETEFYVARVMAEYARRRPLPAPKPEPGHTEALSLKAGRHTKAHPAPSASQKPKVLEVAPSEDFRRKPLPGREAKKAKQRAP